MMRQATFFKCRDGAAAENYAFTPPLLYVWRGGKLPHTLDAMERCGVLERLDGIPSVGIDVTEIHPEWFTTAPRPEPVREEPIKKSAMLEWLGWDDAKLAAARARYGFPRPEVTFNDGATAEEPDRIASSGWYRSTVEKWLEEFSHIGVAR